MKLAERPNLVKFLDDEIVAVVAVPIDEMGTIHTATLHYWHSAQALRFYFVTGKDTEKCRLLNRQDAVKAACVVGTIRGVPMTVQMRGELRIVRPADVPEAVEGYRQKRNSRHDDIHDPANVLLEFAPDWVRFTDFSEGFNAQHFLDLS
jgi:uncharacterized protein YhbP (UPF0306 family)